MEKIPFSVYDFFGYLAAGIVILSAADYSGRTGWLEKKEITIGLGLLGVVVAYAIGHIVANVSGYLLESKLVRAVLRPPEETLFQEGLATKWRRFFPGFYTPLPAETRTRVLTKATNKANISTPGRALYFHCFAVVKRDEATRGRLNSFLNLYGFCRNISMASLMAVVILLIGLLVDWRTGAGIRQNQVFWAAGALFAAVGLFYRYLKFFRHYTQEVFITYAELD